MPRTLLGALSALLLCFVFVAPHARAQTPTAEGSATTTELSSTASATTTLAIDLFNSDDVEAAVRAAFPDAPVMVSIAKCESGFRQYDETGHPLYGGTGGMVGVFQEAAAIHTDAAKGMGYDINTLAGNIAYARYLYDTEGTGPWLASASCWDPTPLTAALHMGSTGSQVKTLQKMLNAFGYLVADSGPGSVGHETTTFGAATQRAVRAFQCDRDIVCAGTEKTSGYGMVGTKTRLALSRMDAKIMASSDLTATQY